MQGLDGRVAVVTGGGGGLGTAICQVLSERGATIVAADADGERAEATAGSCRDDAPESEGLELDVTSSDAVDAAFAGVGERHGRLDILVTAAGISAATDPEAARAAPRRDRNVGVGIAELTDASWSRMLAVHLDGTFYCARAAVPLMQQHGWGSVVCISSIAGTAGIGPLHYAAAKGGILGFVRALARTVAADNIRVNAVCPGVIDAGMTRNYPKSRLDEHVKDVPLGRLGSAREIGTAVAFFASEDGGFTTGACLSPNGGLVIS